MAEKRVTYRPADGDGVGRLELARPEKLNATDDATLRHLTSAVGAAERDRKARAIVVGGQGRAFCTGIDLAAFAAGGIKPSWFRRWDETLARLESLAVPTVAAIRGPCLGGGLQLVLCCDLRVAAADATFGLSAVKHGIIPGLATFRLESYVGAGAARELLLFGETWDARTALRQRLVDRVVPGARLEAVVAELAQQVAGAVRAAVVATKRLALRAREMPLSRFLTAYVNAQNQCLADTESRARRERYSREQWKRVVRERRVLGPSSSR